MFMAGLVAPGKIPPPQRRALPIGGGVGTSGFQMPPRPGQPASTGGGGTSVLPDGTMRTVQPGLPPGMQFDAGSNTAAYGGGGGGIHEKTLPGAMPSVRAAMPAPAAAPQPGGGQGGPPPIDMTQIMDLVKNLKGDPVPRETPPQPLAREADLTPAAEQPSASLGFARAKDASGRMGAAALRAMRDEMTSRGISGSGVEADMTSGILGDVARGQSDAAFQQSLEADRQGYDAKKTSYQGRLNQRTNDMGLVGTGFHGGVTQRGDDVRSNDMTNLFPSIMSILAQQRRVY